MPFGQLSIFSNFNFSFRGWHSMRIHLSSYRSILGRNEKCKYTRYIEWPDRHSYLIWYNHIIGGLMTFLDHSWILKFFKFYSKICLNIKFFNFFISYVTKGQQIVDM